MANFMGRTAYGGTLMDQDSDFGNDLGLEDMGDDEALEKEFQRIIDEFDGQPSTSSSVGIPETKVPETFANPSNLQETVSYLNSTLAAHGFSADLQVPSKNPEVVCRGLNIIFALLQHRQKDMELKKKSEVAVARLRSDLSISERARDMQGSKLAALEQEIGVLRNKQHTLSGMHETEIARLTHKRDELQKKTVDLERRHVQFQHEVKRKEKEFEKLQQRMRALLNEKKKEIRTNAEVAGFWQQQASAMSPSRPPKKGDQETFKAVIASYEVKQEEAQLEIRDLKAALSNLQSEYREIINAQVRQAHAHHVNPAAALVEDEFLENVSGVSPKQLHVALAAKLGALRSRAQALDGDAASHGGQGSAEERRLMTALQEAHSVITDQEQLISAAIAALKQQAAAGGSASSPGDAELRLLKNEYQAKLQGLELRVADAREQAAKEVRLQATREVGDIQAAAKAETTALKSYVVRLQREVQQARGGEEPQKIPAESQNWLDLEHKSHTLGAEQRQFDMERVALRDALTELAPGFGAGMFLEKAISRRSQQVVEDHLKEPCGAN